jgi:chromate transporter
VALAGIFLPGFLLVAGVLPFWQALTRHSLAASAVAGVNATVVGLLGAALYHPVWTGAIHGPVDLAIALVGFTLLATGKCSPLVIIAWCVVAAVTVAVL